MSSLLKTQNQLSPTKAEFTRMAEHFYGYGRWDAPYRFIGPEPGRTRTDDNLELRYLSWKSLEFRSLVDCAAHHRGIPLTKWHQPHPPTQPTWRRLIRLLLSRKGEPTDIETICAYQKENWGRSTGETCVIKLSGLASPNLKTRRDRAKFLAGRIERICEEARVRSPEFIIICGAGQRDSWERTAGAQFDSNGICREGKTVAAIACDPVARGLNNEY